MFPAPRSCCLSRVFPWLCLLRHNVYAAQYRHRTLRIAHHLGRNSQPKTTEARILKIQKNILKKYNKLFSHKITLENVPEWKPETSTHQPVSHHASCGFLKVDSRLAPSPVRHQAASVCAAASPTPAWSKLPPRHGSPSGLTGTAGVIVAATATTSQDNGSSQGHCVQRGEQISLFISHLQTFHVHDIWWAGKQGISESVVGLGFVCCLGKCEKMRY